MPVVHIRHKRVKRGGNQFYKSNDYTGKLGTLCGNGMTSYDLEISSIKRKSFNIEEFEKTFNRTICKNCLNRLEE